MTSLADEIEQVELHFYEVELVVDGQEREIRVYPSGQVEIVAGDEDDDDGPDSH